MQFKQLIKIITSSFDKTLKSMANLDLKLLDIKKINSSKTDADIFVFIKITSKNKELSFMFAFSKESIFLIYNKILQEKKETIDKDVFDLSGEIINITIGDIKRELSEVGVDFDLALPKIVTKEEYFKKHVNLLNVYQLNLSLEKTNLFIEFSQN